MLQANPLGAEENSLRTAASKLKALGVSPAVREAAGVPAEPAKPKVAESPQVTPPAKPSQPAPQPSHESEETEEAEDAVERPENEPEQAEEAPDSETDAADSQDGLKDGYLTILQNGKEVKLSMAEVIEYTQKGFDYTQKTQTLSEKERLVQAERDAFSASLRKIEEARNSYVQKLQIAQRLHSTPVVTDQDIEKLLADGDHESIERARLAEARRQKTVQAIENELAQAQKDAQAQQQAEWAHAIQTNRVKLFDKMPELQQPENYNRLIKYVKESIGATDHEISQTIDHRIWLCIEKARKYDEMMSKAIQRPQKNAPNVHKKRNQTQSKQGLEVKKRREAFTRLKKSGSVHDAAALLKMRAKKPA